MNPWLGLLLSALVGYLLGSFPSSHLAGRLRGKDLRQEGSGNLGATNVFRVLGWQAGVPVLILDIAKGALPVLLGLQGLLPAGPSIDASALAAGIGAVIGHTASPWVGFRGGKGVATAAGVFLTLAPWASIPTIVIWLVMLLSTRIMSIASLAAAVALPVILVAHELSHREQPTRWATLGLALLIGIFVMVKHRSNIERLRRGTEPTLWG